MAESGTEMISIHSCMKAYFMKNQAGEVISVTTPALYVKSVNQDLYRFFSIFDRNFLQSYFVLLFSPF
jgi:hypothetical protein